MMKKCIVFSVLTILFFANVVWAEELSLNEMQNNYLYSYEYEYKQDYENALQCMLRILKSYPNDYFACLRVGWLYYLSGKYSISAFYYQKAVNLKSDTIEPKLGLLLPLMAAQNWQSVKSVALAILKIDNLNYSANSKLAYSYFCLKEYNRAEKYYKKLLKLYPGDIEMKVGLAWTYLKQGKTKEAKKLFNDVLLLSPYNNSALSGFELLSNKETP